MNAIDRTEYLSHIAFGHMAEDLVSCNVLLEAHHGLTSQAHLFCLLLAIARRQKLDLPLEFVRSLSETYRQAHLEIQFALGQLLKGEEQLVDGELGDTEAVFEAGDALRKKIEMIPEASENIVRRKAFRHGFEPSAGK